jgi:DNA protecting protein DprA
MTLASSLPIDSFAALRGMQMLRSSMGGGLGFMPASIEQMRLIQKNGGTLGQFVQKTVAAGGSLDTAQLSAFCAKAAEEQAQLDKLGIKYISVIDTAYPSTLSPFFTAPAILYYRGDIALLKRASVAVVGSREIARNDAVIAHKVAANLVAQGFVITSGLALGIDTWGHRGALNSNGKTIGVLQGGLDPTTRWAATDLVRDVLKKDGLIVSPFPYQTPCTRETLLFRNKITIGLAAGTVIVKAGRHSGTMNAVMNTLNLQRPLTVIAQQNWAQDGVEPVKGYEGGFDLIKAPRKSFAIPKEFTKIAGLVAQAPDLPFAVGIWGGHDYPRLYDLMSSSAAKFSDITLVKPRERTSGTFQVAEPDMSEFETSGGPGKSMHKSGGEVDFGDEDPFANQTTTVLSSGRRRPGM